MVIAGMGGDLMVHILSAAPWTRDVKLILQPMSTQEVLRQWLIAHGYAILWEGIAREGEKFYPLFTATGGQSPRYSPGELWAGRQQQGEDNPHRLAYLTEQIRRRQRALEGMAQSSHPDPGQLDRERTLQNDLQRMREEWIQWQR